MITIGVDFHKRTSTYHVLNEQGALNIGVEARTRRCMSGFPIKTFGNDSVLKDCFVALRAPRNDTIWRSMKLYGKNPVIERLKSNPKSIHRIMIDENHADLSYIRKKCHQWGIGVSTLPHSKIQRLAQNLNTQGILADIEDFAYVPLDELLDDALGKKRVPVFLDNLNDPQNLGGIIRTCGALGDFDIVLPTSESVSVTESVLRVACGGENYLKVARVSNLGHAIEKAKKMGFWIVGTVVEASRSLTEVILQFPLGLVMGSEEKGIRDIILKKVDMQVMVPMKNQRMSLNVAHAASMVCYEIIRQKK